jgi:hypothetical protein
MDIPEVGGSCSVTVSFLSILALRKARIWRIDPDAIHGRKLAETSTGR